MCHCSRTIIDRRRLGSGMRKRIIDDDDDDDDDAQICKARPK